MASVSNVIVEIECQIKLWPSFWKHPIRHVRMKRRWKRAERMANTPFGRRLRELEEDAFINGTGERTGQ